jgi:hypothetical protein
VQLTCETGQTVGAGNDFVSLGWFEDWEGGLGLEGFEARIPDLGRNPNPLLT